VLVDECHHIQNYDEGADDAGADDAGADDARTDTKEIWKFILLGCFAAVLMSATPLKSTVDGKEISVAFKYPMSLAIKDEQITPVKIYLPFVSSTPDRCPLALSQIEGEDQRLVLRAFFLIGGMLRRGHSRCIAFWTTRQDCHAFERIFRTLCQDHFGVSAIAASITQESTPQQRNDAFRDFSADDTPSRYEHESRGTVVLHVPLRLLCGIRILSEGVDFPKCDSVFLPDVPRNASGERGNIQMIQRTQRATRLHPGKTEAGLYFWTDDLVADHCLWRTLIAEDPAFTARVRVLNVDYDRADTKESIDREETLTATFRESIRYHIEALSLDELFYRTLAILLEFVDENRRMPQKKEEFQGFRLGAWVCRQRQARATMPADRHAALEKVPHWVWGAPQAGFEANLALLHAFVDENRRMPQQKEEFRGVKLGAWVHNQRRARETMPADRCAALMLVPHWVWDARGTLAEARGSGGLANVGNTCYLGALCQASMSVPAVRAACVDGATTAGAGQGTAPGPVAAALAGMARALGGAPGEGVPDDGGGAAVRALRSAVAGNRTPGGALSVPGQMECPQELWDTVLVDLEGEAEGGGGGGAPPHPLVAITQVTTAERRTCDACGVVSTPPRKTVPGGLWVSGGDASPTTDADLIAQRWGGRPTGGYTCGADGCLGENATVERWVDGWSTVLCLRIDRVRIDHDAGVLSLCRRPVALSAELCLPDAPSGEAPPPRYRLRGVVRHRGESSASGHYIADVRVDGGRGAARWVRCDDAHVWSVSEARVTGAEGDAVMVFYERVPDPPRAREGPCDVCKDLPSPITRGRCGAAVGSLRTCLRRPECQMTIVKIEALLEQCGGESPSRTTTVVMPDGTSFEALVFLRSIATNWKRQVLDSVGDGATYAHLTADRMSQLEARAPAWLKDLIVRWRTPPCAACAAHPNRSMGGRCGTSISLLGCSLRPQR